MSKKLHRAVSKQRKAKYRVRKQLNLLGAPYRFNCDWLKQIPSIHMLTGEKENQSYFPYAVWEFHLEEIETFYWHGKGMEKLCLNRELLPSFL